MFDPVWPIHRNDLVKMVVVRDGDVPLAGDSGWSDDGHSHSEGWWEDSTTSGGANAHLVEAEVASVGRLGA